MRGKVKEAENEVKNAAAEQERLARYLQAAGSDSAGIGTAGWAVSDCIAVDASGIVLAGRLVRLGNMSYFNSGEQYGFLRDGEDGGLPRFVAALPEDAAALKELFAGGRPEAMPMDFSGEWNFRPAAEATAGRGSLWEHFAAGGLVMLPILLCAWLTLWMLLRRIFSWMRNPVRKISDAYAAGLACMIGHIWPVFYKFKGGKGVVVTAVIVLMTNWKVGLVLILMFVLLVASTKFISLGSVMCSLVYPLILSRMNRTDPQIIMVFAMAVTVIVVLKHRSNIKRLIEGKENKISFSRKDKKPAQESEKKDPS